jgi:small conductance mechanosensitive channel
MEPIIGLASRMATAAAVCFLLAGTGPTAAAPSEGAQQSSTESPLDIPVEVLQMRIKHLSAKELAGEADRWLSLLKDVVRRLNEAKTELYRENLQLEAAEAEATKQPAAAKRQEAAIELQSEAKERMLERVAILREERVKAIDRLNAVLDELSAKLGLAEKNAEQEQVLEYRRYVDAVEGVEVDTSDWQALRSTVYSWIVSPEGGRRLAWHFSEFVLIVAGFWLLSLLLRRLARKAMSLASGASQILSRFVVNAVSRITIIVGLLLGLAALEINITPLVAVIGAAGFIIAFALQNTLSNFASGLMIMFYKPFDIGDFVETPAVSGTVKSMTLVTTNMLTPDNKLLVVPNNELWGKVITNVTGSSERRVDLVFGIGYDDDIALAERVLAEVVAAHPQVLKEPEPVIRVAELADSSVNLICRPWVKTPDYWPVYWEITRAVKERFDAEGISIPFPQRDVHHYPAAGAAIAVVD